MHVLRGSTGNLSLNPPGRQKPCWSLATGQRRALRCPCYPCACRLRTAGTDMSAVEVYADEYGGYGVRAVRDIAPHEVVARVPRHVTIDGETAWADPAVASILRELYFVPGECCLSCARIDAEADLHCLLEWLNFLHALRRRYAVCPFGEYIHASTCIISVRICWWSHRGRRPSRALVS